MATKKEQALQVLNIKYRSARLNLLVLIIATVLNVIFIFTSNISPIVTLILPYLLVLYGAHYTGVFSEEYYQNFEKTAGAAVEFKDTSYMVIMCALAAVIIVAFIACWFFSKKKSAALIAAVALLAIDTVCLIIFSFNILNLLIRVWIGYNIVAGLLARKKMREVEALPDDEPEEQVNVSASPYGYDDDEEEEYATDLLYSDNYFDEDEAEEKSDTSTEKSDEE